MAKKSWHGMVLYSGYLAALGAIWAAVDSATMSPNTGIGLAILTGVGMAIYWPRW